MEKPKKAVDVISVCNAEGEILPLRMQMVDETRQLLRIHIQQAKRVQEITHVGVEAVIFACWAHVHGRDLQFRLKYMFRSHTWYLL